MINVSEQLVASCFRCIWTYEFRKSPVMQIEEWLAKHVSRKATPSVVGKVLAQGDMPCDA